MNWTITDTGIFFAVLSFIMVLVQGPLLSRLSRVCSDRTLILGGNLILAGGFVLMDTSTRWQVYLAAGLFSLGNGLMWPSVLSVLSKTTDKKSQGVIQGFAGSVGSLASIVGLIAGGFLYGAIGPKTFLLSAGLIVLVFLMSFRLPKG